MISFVLLTTIRIARLFTPYQLGLFSMFGFFKNWLFLFNLEKTFEVTFGRRKMEYTESKATAFILCFYSRRLVSNETHNGTTSVMYSFVSIRFILKVERKSIEFVKKFL